MFDELVDKIKAKTENDTIFWEKSAIDGQAAIFYGYTSFGYPPLFYVSRIESENGELWGIWGRNAKGDFEYVGSFKDFLKPLSANFERRQKAAREGIIKSLLKELDKFPV